MNKKNILDMKSIKDGILIFISTYIINKIILIFLIGKGILEKEFIENSIGKVNIMEFLIWFLVFILVSIGFFKIKNLNQVGDEK